MVICTVAVKSGTTVLGLRSLIRTGYTTGVIALPGSINWTGEDASKV